MLHGTWGAITNLTKRQHNEKARKAEYRYKHQKRKELYAIPKDSEDEFDFPLLSKLEMLKVKKGIRKKMRSQKIRDFLPFFIAFLLLAFCFSALFLST